MEQQQHQQQQQQQQQQIVPKELDDDNNNNNKEEEEPALKKTKMSSTSSDDDNTAPSRTPRYKRRKVAIFLAYCGAGYQGMQKNPGAKTIEGDLEDALYLARAVPEDERGQHKRYDWARSARTDKGVSAVGQVVSGRFFVDPPGFVDRLNNILSPQIRVFGFKRVTPSFSSKKFCDRRRYVYLLPVFALDPGCHRDRESVMESFGSGEELLRCRECSERGRKVFGVLGNKRNLRNDDLVQSDISSNTCDALMDVDVDVEGGMATQVTAQSGISANTRDALMEQVKEEESNACLENGNVVAQSGISSNKEGALVLLLLDAEEKGGGEDLKNGVGSVKAEVLFQPDVPLKKEEGDFLLNAEVEDDKDIGRTYADKNGGAVLEGNGIGEGSKGEFKYSEDVKERFNRILKYYEGTHNFHNFTTRTKAEDPAAKRYIVSFQANTTLTIEGIEFVKCEVLGQSFMLHQIRKMMGMAVAVMRNFAPESLYKTAFDQVVRINVPTAPEVGLYLDECFFTSYNNKWNGTHEEVSMNSYAKEAEEFKLKNIYSHIANMEHKYGAVALWLHSLNRRNYPDLCPVQEGLREDKAAEGIVEDKAAEGIVEDKAAEGLVEDKAVEGPTEDKEAEGLVEDKVVEGLTKDKAAEGLVEDKAAEGLVEDKAVEGPTEHKEAEGLVEDKVVEGLTKDKAADRLVEDKAAEGLAADKAADGQVENKAAEGP